MYAIFSFVLSFGMGPRISFATFTFPPHLTLPSLATTSPARPLLILFPRSLTACSSHRLVLETLEPLPGDRKCFRMINGVLVQRTVQDVVPALKTNSEGLKKVLDDLLKQYKMRQDEMEKWKVQSIRFFL